MGDIARKWLCGILLASSWVLALPWAQANVVLGSTRVVYPADEREVTLQLQNVEKVPRLVQAWVDRGDPEARPDSADAPFFLTPPIVRLEADESTALRLMFTHEETLPQDRESLFWLNVMDIPPLINGSDVNYLQLAYRSRIKLFFRPVGLPGSVAKAAETVRWTLVRAQSGNYALRGRNDSAFYVSFNQVELLNTGSGGKGSSGMIAPYASADFPLQSLDLSLEREAQVRATWIDDYGALRPFETKLSP